MEIAEKEQVPEVQAPELTDGDPFVYELQPGTNLVFDWEVHPKGKKALAEIGSKILQDFEDEHDACKEYRERWESNWKIVSGFLPPKTGRFKDMSNAHLPEAIQNLVRQHLLLFDEIFGDFTNFMAAVPVGDDPVAQMEAKLLERHMLWQFSEQITDFPRQMDRGMMHFLFGDLNIRSYYDETLKRNRHDVMSPDDLVTPYANVSCAVDYSDVPWTAFVLRQYRHELESAKGVWAGVDRVLNSEPPPWDTDPEAVVAKGTNERMGKEAVDSKSAPYVLIWWEGWMTLPKPDEEGEADFSRQRFMQCIVDKESRNILWLSLHEEEDWQDLVRFRRQMSERDAYIAEATAASQEAMAYSELSRRLEEQVMLGQMTPQLMEVQRAAMPVPRPAPTPTSWMMEAGMVPDETGQMMQPPKPTPARMVPIYLKTHVVAIEPLSGVYGLGMAHIQADLNTAMNISFAQFSDAAAMANAGCNVLNGGVEFEEDEPEIGAGRFLKLKVNPFQSIKDAMMPLSSAQPQPGMIEVVNQLHQYASNFGQASEVLTGAPGKSGEAFRGLQARMEAAQKPISTMGAKLARGLTQVLKNNARLNAVHMQEEELFHFYEHSQVKVLTPMTVRRSMYERSYKWQMTASMRFETNTQRVAEADELVGMIQVHPAMQGNLAFVHGALVKSLQARGMMDMVDLLGPPPPKPMTPFGIPAAPPPGMVSPGAAPPGQGPPAAPPGPPVEAGPPPAPMQEAAQ